MTVENVVMVSGRHWHDAAVAVAMASGRWPDTAVSPPVFDQLAEAGVEAFLTHGADRYLTGVAVARWLGGLPGRAGAAAPVVIASGETLAGALAAGPLSYAFEAPVLLTPRSVLHPEVAQYLRDARTGHVVLMGGTAALSADVETAVINLGISRVDRIAGETPYHTAAEAARYAAELFGDACFGGSRVGLARGDLITGAVAAAPPPRRRCSHGNAPRCCSPTPTTSPNPPPNTSTACAAPRQPARSPSPCSAATTPSRPNCSPHSSRPAPSATIPRTPATPRTSPGPWRSAS